MKLSTRLGILVLNAGLGLVVLAGVALYSLHDSQLEDRRSQIRILLTLAGQQVSHFQKLEQSGKLSRPEAQRRAIEAMSSLRDKGSYVFARGSDNLVLVHPDKRKLGRTTPAKNCRTDARWCRLTTTCCATPISALCKSAPAAPMATCRCPSSTR